MTAAGLLTLSTTLLIVTTPLHAQTESIDVRTEARAVVANIRDFVLRTKEGSPIKTVLQNLDDLQSFAVNLLSRLPHKEISECETQTVIKLSAAGIGSHEVLDVLRAEDNRGLMSARVRVALAFLSRVAQHLDDKLSLSSDVGPELTAIIFGVNTTVNIITIAGDAIKVAEGPARRSRREASMFEVSNDLDLDTRAHHLSVRSPQSPWSIDSRVQFPRPGQWNAQVGANYDDGRLRGGVSGSFDSSGRRQLDGTLGIQTPDKRLSLDGIGGFRSAPGVEAQPFGGAKFDWTSRNGRVNVGVQGDVQRDPSGRLNPSVGVGVKIKLP